MYIISNVSFLIISRILRPHSRISTRTHTYDFGSPYPYSLREIQAAELTCFALRRLCIMKSTCFTDDFRKLLNTFRDVNLCNLSKCCTVVGFLVWIFIV